MPIDVKSALENVRTLQQSLMENDSQAVNSSMIRGDAAISADDIGTYIAVVDQQLADLKASGASLIQQRAFFGGQLPESTYSYIPGGKIYGAMELGKKIMQSPRFAKGIEKDYGAEYCEATKKLYTWYRDTLHDLDEAIAKMGKASITPKANPMPKL